MARKIFMNKQHAYAFAKVVAGTVEKEPTESIWLYDRPPGYVVFYDATRQSLINKERAILYKEPQEVNWDLFMLHSGRPSYAEPMTFMFTKSIVASGDGIQKAILYLEST